MRKPPNLGGRKGPPRCQTRRGQIRNYHLSHRNEALHSGQALAYFPGRGSKSLYSVAASVRDDGLAPIRVRTFALGVTHRLRFGGTVDLADERLLLRLSAERRRQLAALRRMYR